VIPPGVSLDFQEAIDAHTAWKHHFFSALKSAEAGALDTACLASDAECALGRWIREQTLQWPGDPTFAQLQLEHREFHRLASALADPVMRNASPLQHLLMEGRLQEHSARMVEAIRLLGLRGKREQSAPALVKAHSS